MNKEVLEAVDQFMEDEEEDDVVHDAMARFVEG